MREFVVVILIAVLFVVGMSKDKRTEEQPCETPQLSSVWPNHATRVYAIYSCADGTTRRYSIHASNTVRCGTTTISVKDYLTGKEPYGKCEK